GLPAFRLRGERAAQRGIADALPSLHALQDVVRSHTGVQRMRTEEVIAPAAESPSTGTPQTQQTSASQQLGGSKLDPPPAGPPSGGTPEPKPPAVPGPIRNWNAWL